MMSWVESIYSCFRVLYSGLYCRFSIIYIIFTFHHSKIWIWVHKNRQCCNFASKCMTKIYLRQQIIRNALFRNFYSTNSSSKCPECGDFRFTYYQSTGSCRLNQFELLLPEIYPGGITSQNMRLITPLILSYIST